MLVFCWLWWPCWNGRWVVRLLVLRHKDAPSESWTVEDEELKSCRRRRDNEDEDEDAINDWQRAKNGSDII